MLVDDISTVVVCQCCMILYQVVCFSRSVSMASRYFYLLFFFFFFNDTAPPEIYTLSLHDALPIWPTVSGELAQAGLLAVIGALAAIMFYIWIRFEWQIGRAHV